MFQLSTSALLVFPIHFQEVQLLPLHHSALYHHATATTAYNQCTFCARYEVKIVMYVHTQSIVHTQSTVHDSTVIHTQSTSTYTECDTYTEYSTYTV